MGANEIEVKLVESRRQATVGEEVIGTRGAEPLARLVSTQRQPERVFGRDRGLFEVPEDFNAPLPEEVLRAFGR